MFDTWTFSWGMFKYWFDRKQTWRFNQLHYLQLKILGFGHVTSVMSQQDNWPIWLSNDLTNRKWSMQSECTAVGCCEKLTKKSGFSFYGFSLKNEAKKMTVASGSGSLGSSHKEVMGPKHHDLLCSKHLGKKMLHRSHTAEHSVWAQIQCSAEGRGCTNSVCPPPPKKTQNPDQNRLGQIGEPWQNVASER